MWHEQRRRQRRRQRRDKNPKRANALTPKRVKYDWRTKGRTDGHTNGVPCTRLHENGNIWTYQERFDPHRHWHRHYQADKARIWSRRKRHPNWTKRVPSSLASCASFDGFETKFSPVEVTHSWNPLITELSPLKSFFFFSYWHLAITEIR